MAYRKPATGLLLRQLQRQSFGDYGIIIRNVLLNVQDLPQLVDYIYGWARGHFILEAVKLGG